MSDWSPYPVVYEVNTWVWLHDLSREADRPVTLGTVPQTELERLAGYGFNALWLMGVWQRSPKSRAIAREHPHLQEGYRRALPDFTPEDVVGSPYAVYTYRVDTSLGGDKGLADLRKRLRRMGILLILDFVPNHLSADHSWLRDHPDRLVQGTPEVLRREPDNFFICRINDRPRVFAHGRDPYFGGWTDTVQIDYRRPETRRAMTDVLLDVARRCDGVRCDMAMLVTHEVFQRIWGGEFFPHGAEFWPDAIAEVKARYPDFLLVAEVYWNMEYALQQMGFDYTYDKRLYDLLMSNDAMKVRSHLRMDMNYHRKLIHFIENHDERRAMDAFGPRRGRLAATLVLALPGMRLLYDGQIEGRRLKLPVQLCRRHPEPPEESIEQFYRQLLAVLRMPVFHDGSWQLLEPKEAWDGNASHSNFIAYIWTLGEECWLVTANLAESASQCRLYLDLPHLGGRSVRLLDIPNEAEYIHSGNDILDHGLYVALDGYGYHLLQLHF